MLRTYPDMVRQESDEWALPMRSSHEDTDYSSVFDDVSTIDETIDNMHDLLLADFFGHEKIPIRPRSMSVPNQPTFMDEDGSSQYDADICEQLIIDNPSDFDVLCGRGSRTNHHKGNLYWLQEKAKLQGLYLAAAKKEKRAISLELIEQIEQIGGRFLEPIKRQDGSIFYLEVTDRKKLLKKAGQTLREINDPMLYLTKRERYRKPKKRANSLKW